MNEVRLNLLREYRRSQMRELFILNGEAITVHLQRDGEKERNLRLQLPHRSRTAPLQPAPNQPRRSGLGRGSCPCSMASSVQ